MVPTGAVQPLMCIEVVNVVEGDITLKAGGSFVRRSGCGCRCSRSRGEKGRWVVLRNCLALFQTAVDHF